MVIEFQRSTIHHPNITLAIRSSDSCNAGTLFYFILFILFYFISFFESAANVMICFCPIIERQSQHN